MPNHSPNQTCPGDQVSRLSEPHALKNGRTGRATAGMFGLFRSNLKSFQQHFNATPIATEELDPRYRHILDVGAGMASTAAELKASGLVYAPVDPMYCSEWSIFELLSETERSIRSINQSLFHPKIHELISPSYYSAHITQSSLNPLAMYRVASERFSTSFLTGSIPYYCGALPDALPDLAGCQLALVGNYLLFREHHPETVITSIQALLSLCGEVRIHPVVDYNGAFSSALKPVMSFYSYHAELIEVPYYEFHSNLTLKIRTNKAPSPTCARRHTHTIAQQPVCNASQILDKKDQCVLDEHPSPLLNLSALGQTALCSASLAALTQMAQGALQLMGYASEQTAKQIGILTSVALLVVSGGSGIGTVAAIGTHGLLKYAGCSETTARRTATTLAFCAASAELSLSTVPIAVLSTIASEVGCSAGTLIGSFFSRGIAKIFKPQDQPAVPFMI